jgi:hypothetical protein
MTYTSSLFSRRRLPYFAAGLALLGAGFSAQAQQFAPIVQYSLNLEKKPLGLALGDVNHDGKLDILAVSETDSVSVLTGQGDGTFQRAQSHVVYNFLTVALKLADVNGDDQADIVAAGTGGVSVLTAQGSYFFPSKAYALQMTSNPGALAVADVNGDNRPDIVTVSNSADNATVLLNKGDGTFGGATTFPTGAGSNPEAVVVRDMNGDGHADIVMVGAGAGAVLAGRGDGTFGIPVYYTASLADGGLGVAVGDANGDGLPDILTTSANMIKVYLHQSSGGFAPAARYQSVASVGLAVTDLDGDGRLEVVTAGFGDNAIGVLPGLANGTFGPAALYPTGANSGPISVAVGDVDGNGRPDIVASNYDGARVGVLLNTLPGLYTNGPAALAAGAPLALRGTNLAGATAATFTSTANVTTTVPAASFISTNYTASPNVIELTVPSTLAEGAYAVAVVTPRGTTNGFRFTVGTTLALTPAGLRAESIGLAPSPAHTSTTLSMPGLPGVAAVQLRLSDALGRIIRTQEVALPAAGLRQEVDLHGLTSGLYLLQVQAGPTRVARRLLVD